MQIDFHHAVTYVVARTAGFGHEEARTVAHAAQYVDDAINGGTIKFRTGQMYQRISSAHSMADYRNFKELANHQVWIPFHFLPGNDGKAMGTNPEATFGSKIICRPNSHVAQDMVNTCLADRNKNYGLYRLGITLHVYADTWAHQGFAGINSKANQVENLRLLENEEESSWSERMSGYFGELWDDAKSSVVGNALPLGHGPALTYPDMPFLGRWEYITTLGDGTVDTVRRDNRTDFMQAARWLYRACRSWLDPNLDFPNSEPLPPDIAAKIEHNFKTFEFWEGEDRHDQWIKSIAQNFGFQDDIGYIAKGRTSWKDIALDTKKDREDGNERYTYKPEFITSHWKLFHDALQAHRFDVLHDILPRYGICAA